MADGARETTRDEVENRKENAARNVRYYTYLPQGVYHMDAHCKHVPFEPTNMDSEELALVDADLSFLAGQDAWCHQQSPNAIWNLFFFDRMHYTVGEWLESQSSNWLDAPPWLKVSLATWEGRDGVNPYRFLLEDEEVQILLSDPQAHLVRPAR